MQGGELFVEYLEGKLWLEIVPDYTDKRRSRCQDADLEKIDLLDLHSGFLEVACEVG